MGRGNSGKGSGGSLNGFEPTTNENLRDITREMAKTGTIIAGNKSEKMGKLLDKHTDDGDKLALIDTKTGKPEYQMVRKSKGNWEIVDKKGKTVHKSDTAGALRFMSGVSWATNSDYEQKKRNSLTYPIILHKKKKG